MRIPGRRSPGAGEVERSGFTPWAVTAQNADAARRLLPHHDDRMLPAQAYQRSAVLAGVDRRLPAYGVRLLGQ